MFLAIGNRSMFRLLGGRSYRRAMQTVSTPIVDAFLWRSGKYGLVYTAEDFFLKDAFQALFNVTQR